MATKKRKGPGGIADVFRNEVKESSAVPDGGYLTEVVDAEAVQTREMGKLMYHVQYQVVEPEEYAGSRLDDYLVIGSEEDPDAEEPATWKRSRGAKRLHRLFRCAGVLDDFGEDHEDNCETLKECKVYAVVSADVEAEGDFKGEVRNRITNYYEPDEREPKVTGELPEPGGKKSVKSSLKAVKGKAKAAKPTDDDDEDDEDEKPAPKKAPAKKAAASDDDDDDEEEEEEEDDDDDEEDDDEDEDESPSRKGRAAK